VALYCFWLLYLYLRVFKERAELVIDRSTAKDGINTENESFYSSGHVVDRWHSLYLNLAVLRSKFLFNYHF